jgi:DNA polymerase-1
MINSYKESKDLYSTVAAKLYHTTYENCLEHNPDGTTNADGKKRRKNTKAVLLGILYGRGANSISEQMKCSVEEAQDVIDSFYNAFPTVKKWSVETDDMARKLGYVTTVWGRRRHVRDMMLPRYTFETTVAKSKNFNPFFDDIQVEDESNELVEYFKKKLFKCKGRKEVLKVKQEALAQGIQIQDNGSKIAQAQRQCVNSRIQGSAADLSKMAMIDIYNDKILNDLDYHMQIVVHDEIIGECPIENADKVKTRLCELMINSTHNEVNVPMKCDPEVSVRWNW